MDSLEKLLNVFTDGFYNDNLPLLSKIHQEIQSNPSHLSELSKFSCPEYSKHLSDIKDVQTCMELIQSPIWVAVRESADVRIDSRGGGSDFFTKATVRIQSNIFQVLAVLSEADLITTW